MVLGGFVLGGFVLGGFVLHPCYISHPFSCAQSNTIVTYLYYNSRPRNSFFGASKLLLPGARPGSKTNFCGSKLYVHFLRNENILIL